MNIPRRAIVAGLVAGLAAGLQGLAGCAGLGGPPTLKLSLNELQALAQKAFPVQRRLLEVFDASADAPRLRLLPESRRLGALLDVALRDRLFGGQWQGVLDFDAALRWDGADSSVRLAQVRVRDFTLGSAGSAPRTAAQQLAAALAERALEGLVLYRLPDARSAELQRRGLAPGAIDVTTRGVEVTFSPLPR